MSILQDLLALRQSIPENQDEWEAAHEASAEEYHSHAYQQNDTSAIAASDEFTVEQDSDDMVHLIDDEQSIRASMPYHVWLALCQETVHKHVMKHQTDEDH